jgi:serine/threonine protein kinase/tetratricopeptide (TPR) repeat protein
MTSMVAIPSDPARREVRGQRLGRYVLLDELGAGGMGVVLSAYDPELHRRVAIKLLRPDAIADGSKEIEHTVRLDGSGEPRHLVRERILAEGRAMASLSHPNLVAVYEVGEVGERVFLAMEQVDGIRLSDWLGEAERSWREVVSVFVQAGRALAAAHAVDLVHGDVKPDNVLVERSGRVRVLDFGLARAAGTRPDGDHLCGTPRYMAPEQFALRPADARSDQFAFCVALHEALYRERPFEGITDAEIAASVMAGELRPPTRRRGPRWLERAVSTGLSAEPAARFASMEELLAVLEGRPQATRRRISLAVTSSLATVLTVVGFAVGHEPPKDLCTGGWSQVRAVWDRSTADRVRASFAASGRPHATSSADRVADRLDTYAAAWTGMHRATCQATLRGEQSPDLLDRRMACLSRGLGQVSAAVELFAGLPDGAIVDRAIDMVGEFEPPSTCANAAALLGQPAPPADPAVRARLAELERRIDRVDLERQAGRTQRAADEARAVEEAARPLGNNAVGGKAARVLGRALMDLGRPAEAREPLLRSVDLATRAGDERLAANSLITLVSLVGERDKRHREAELIGRLAEAALERPAVRGDPDLRARLLIALGVVANDEVRPDRAAELQREALAIRLRTLSPDDPEVAVAENTLANSLVNLRQFDEAREHFERALAIRLRVFGDRHPLTASIHINLGVAALDERRLAESRRHFLAAFAILESMPEQRSYANVLNNLGNVETSMGDLDAARRYHEAALAARERKLGPSHPDVATSLHNVAVVFRMAGDPGRALELHRRCLAIREKALGAENPYIASTLASLGEDLRELGRLRESLVYHARAKAVAKLRADDKSPKRALLEVFEGMALADSGRRREAIPVLERALAVIEPSEFEWAGGALALARSLEPRGPRTHRTRLLALQALVTFTAHRDRRHIAQVAAFLARGARR